MRSGYDGIKAFAREAVECDTILSASLDGLIVGRPAAIDLERFDVVTADLASSSEATRPTFNAEALFLCAPFPVRA